MKELSGGKIIIIESVNEQEIISSSEIKNAVLVVVREEQPHGDILFNIIKDRANLTKKDKFGLISQPYIKEDELTRLMFKIDKH